MNWTLAPVLGFSLAMDVFAVSIAIVLCMGTVGAWAMIRVAGVFGFFQGAMPLVGWLLAYRFASVISSFGHWVAFVLLVAVGAKTIYEGVKNGEDCNFASDPTRGWLLVVLAVGTSLDALAVGVNFVALNVPPLYTALVIGIITFFLSLGGMVFARRLGTSMPGRMAVFGGLVLIGIGFRILVSRLWL